MNQDHFLQLLRLALQAIREPDLYETERAYQGALLAEIRARLDQDPIWPGSPLVEQEYEKNAAAQGVDVRPDVIIHYPFDRGVFEHHGQGNYAVLELRRRAGKQTALRDYAKLNTLCTVLDYAMGIFINVDATEVFMPAYDGEANNRLHGFAVQLRGGLVYIQEGHPNVPRR